MVNIVSEKERILVAGGNFYTGCTSVGVCRFVIVSESGLLVFY